MSQELRQSLQQKQMLKLSPQQVQLMKLMQVTTLDMEQRIKEELQNNPALEEEEDAVVPENIPVVGGSVPDFDKDDYAYKSKSNNYRAPEDTYTPQVKFQQGLHEQLNNELEMLPLTEKQLQIGRVIIGNLDEDGYLQRSPDAMVNDMAFSMNIMVSEQEVREVLECVRTLEPWGIGGRDLRECLLIQINCRLEAASETDTALGDIYVLKNAQSLLLHCFDDFVKRQTARIAAKLKMEEEDVRDAVDLIKKLNPKPGQGGAESDTRVSPAVIPDFYLYNDNGELVLSLNAKNDPRLKVSPAYEKMLSEYAVENPSQSAVERRRNREAALFAKQKVESARWFMEMLQQRRRTMMKVMRAVVDFQHECFVSGDETLLRPMRLKDIAQMVDMDVSTVSRVINNKYIQTSAGTFAVKSLFSQGLENEEGEEVSTTKIKLALRGIIEEEDKTDPYTDDQLVDLLKQKGFAVARRTVAKYREGLGLPVARLRKSY